MSKLEELLKELAALLWVIAAVIALGLPRDPIDQYLQRWPSKYLGHHHYSSGNQYVERMWVHGTKEMVQIHAE
jgi:hypothetical protein